MSTAEKIVPVTVPYVGLAAQHSALKAELMRALERVFSHANFILGQEVAEFEAEFASYCGAKYAVGVGNGTDALVLALKAVGIGSGDEVITAPNSFLASASAIAMAGANPVFVDVRSDYNLDPDLLEAAITPRTRAILPVHLTGRPADMRAVMAVAEKHELAVVEDAAQAVGATYEGQRVGTFGIAGCFSFHPLKNLNACGDAGMIITDDPSVHSHLIKARNHGLDSGGQCDAWSPNSRLDAVQAAMLMVKMKYLDEWTEARRRNAAFYRERVAGLVKVPEEHPHEYAVYQTFVVECDRRDELQSYLAARGVETKVHYPVPIHLQGAARALGYQPGDFPVTEQQAGRILSLPVYPELSRQQLEWVASAIETFYVDGIES